MNRPLLTVAIPNYNGGANLRRALLSCAAIDLSKDELEILIVDNASTDNSLMIAEKFAERNAQVRIVRNETNIGRVENWERALLAARGTYLFYLFANDEIPVDNNIGFTVRYMYENSISMAMHDILFEDTRLSLPGLRFSGPVDMQKFTEYFFERQNFACLGILQQYIYDRGTLISRSITFDPSLPRTTDRRFIAEAIRACGRIVYYNPKVNMVWRSAPNRFHNQVHGDRRRSEELYREELASAEYVADVLGIPLQRIGEYALGAIWLERLIFMARAVIGKRSAVMSGGAFYGPLLRPMLRRRGIYRLNYLRVARSIMRGGWFIITSRERVRRNHRRRTVSANG